MGFDTIEINLVLLDIDYLEELNIDSHGGPRESEISNS